MKSIRCYIFSFLILFTCFFGLPALSGCSFSRTASVDVETSAGDTTSDLTGSTASRNSSEQESTTEAETTATQPYYLVSGEGDGNTRYVKLCGADSEVTDSTDADGSDDSDSSGSSNSDNSDSSNAPISDASDSSDSSNSDDSYSSDSSNSDDSYSSGSSNSDGADSSNDPDDSSRSDSVFISDSETTDSSDAAIYPDTAPAILALGDNILLYWFDYNYMEGFSEEAVHFILYSPRNGRAIATADYDLAYMQGYPEVIDDVLFFIDDGTMYVFDKTLTLTAQISGLDASYIYELVAGGTVLYYTDWEIEQAYRAEIGKFLSDRSVTLLTLSNLTFERAFPDYIASSVYDVCGGTGYFAAQVVDDDYLDYIVIADAATEEVVLMLPFQFYSYLNMSGSRFLTTWYDSTDACSCLGIYNPAAYTDSISISDVLDGVLQTVSYGTGGSFFTVPGTSLFFETYENLETFEHYYVCYEPDGSYLSSFRCQDTSLEDGYYGISYDYLYLEDISCVVFSYSENEGEWGLFFWLLDVAVNAPADFPEEFGTLANGKSPAEEVTGTPAEEQGELTVLYERAETLSEETGLTILVGKDVSLLSDGGYDVAAEGDYDALSEGLDMLEYILSRYPEGFFDQLRFGNMYSIRVALAGSITSDGSVYLTSAGGYVTNGSNCVELVIDVNDSGMENAFYHEFSHIIDRYLEYISMYEEGSPYSEDTWLTYTPDGFSYCEDYTDYYTFYWDNYTAEYDEYFLNAYSVINATEDRAQLMEDAFGRKWSNNGYGIAQIAGLKEKYQYYCDCIRWGFDTTGWPEVTEWEAILYE